VVLAAGRGQDQSYSKAGQGVSAQPSSKVTDRVSVNADNANQELIRHTLRGLC
jgi:hypothetical protein